MKPKIIKKILVPEEAIQKRIQELGWNISKDYKGKELVVIPIMRGAMLFSADLVRRITIPATVDFIFAASYKGSKSTGTIRIIKDTKEDIKGKHVLLVEDVVDTGLTLSCLRSHLEARSPKSLKACVLLNKLARRQIKVKLDYIGFAIPNEFVVGYGLDYLELYRNLPYVATLTNGAKEKLK